MAQVSATLLRTLVREALAGQGLPWGGVRESDEWIPGQKTRAGTLNRMSNLSGEMSDLNMQLRQLYLDALDAPMHTPQYDEILDRIAAVRDKLNELEILYATTRSELDKR